MFNTDKQIRLIDKITNTLIALVTFGIVILLTYHLC